VPYLVIALCSDLHETGAAADNVDHFAEWDNDDKTLAHAKGKQRSAEEQQSLVEAYLVAVRSME
jgi:hypothetical protein